jgi:peptidoglycan/xylan/chitin deacetylase (PgdA/CDA1 family)
MALAHGTAPSVDEVTVPPTPAWTLPALMYHSVSAMAGPYRDLAVPPGRLAEHLAALTDAGYRLAGLSEALDLLDAGTTDRVVALTFDDGYRDFLTSGLPALEKAAARATLYASVGHLGGSAGWLGRWSPGFGPMLTWDELSAVDAAGVEIGNHGLIHHPLDVLPGRRLRYEIVCARDRLEQHLQHPIRSFAYPHGYNGRRVRGVVAWAGHDNATEVGRRLHTPALPRFAIPRLQPLPDQTGSDVVAMCSRGESGPVPKLKRAAQPGWRVARRIARAAGWNLT